MQALEEVRADYLQGREMGVFAIRGTGVVTTDGDRHELPKGGCLYIGRGVRDISFASEHDEKALFISSVRRRTPATDRVGAAGSG